MLSLLLFHFYLLSDLLIHSLNLLHSILLGSLPDLSLLDYQLLLSLFEFLLCFFTGRKLPVSLRTVINVVELFCNTSHLADIYWLQVHLKIVSEITAYHLIKCKRVHSNSSFPHWKETEWLYYFKHSIVHY